MPSPTLLELVLVYSYIRFSHPSQSKGDSLRRQTDLAEAWCERARKKGRKVRLDTRLTLRDLGVSAFRGKNATVGNLRTFLDAVKAGKVKPGSILIVESIDRISRQGIDEGYDLIKSILRAGVHIVTLSPEREFDAQATRSLSKGALEIQLILERAAEESERKSERVAQAWKRNKQLARETGRILTRRLPGWIAAEGDRLVLIPQHAATVRRIFELAAAGQGQIGITKRLIAEGVPPFLKVVRTLDRTTGEATERPAKWSRTYVKILLDDRRVLGEMQFRDSAGGPDGEPVKGYFPAAITEHEFNAARAARWGRQHKRGRPATYVNTFGGLIRCATDGSTCMATTRTEGGKKSRVIVNSAAPQGWSRCHSFPYDTFEQAILSKLAEIDPRDVLPDDGGPDPVKALEGEWGRVEDELAKLAADLDAEGFSPTLGKRVRSLEARKLELEGEVKDARRLAAHPLSEAWRECQPLFTLISESPEPDEARLRLRALLRRVVDSIWMLVVKRGRDRLCAAQIWFADGKRQRTYAILHRPPKSNGKARQEGAWWVRSFADVALPGEVDLRRPDDAKELEEELASLDLTALAAGD